MERARRTAPMPSSRRKTNPASTSPQSTPESVPDPIQSVSPSLSNDLNSPQSAPPARRSSKTLHHSSSFSAPGSSRSVHLRKRSRTMDDFGSENGVEDNDSPHKGGHTLRRRARVDYTFEQIDDEVIVPSSTSSARTRKRRSDNSYDSEEVNFHDIGRRRASLDSDMTSSRRRNPARKSSAERAIYIEEPEEDEHEVQDTIEVVGSVSDDETSASAAVSHSNTNSQNSLPLNPGKPASTEPEKPATDEPAEKAKDSAIAPNAPKSEPEDEDGEKPEDQLRQEAGASTPNGADLKTAEVGQSETQNVTKVPEQLPSKQTPETESSQTESNAVSTKEEPVDETRAVGADAIHSTMTTCPKTDMVEEAGIQSKPAASTSANEHSGKEAGTPSSPSLQIRKQLNGSPNGATADLTMYPNAEEDAMMQDAGNEEPKDEPMEEAVQAEATVDSASLMPAPEVKVIPAPAQASSDAATEVVGATQAKTKLLPFQVSAPAPVVVSRPQPTPVGRWSYLTPYVDGEYTTYPEKKESMTEDETPAEEPTAEDKDSNGMEPMVEDNEDVPEAFPAEAPTPALNTPTRGSPVPESIEPTASNSPAPAADDAEDGDVSDSDDVEVRRFFRYRKLRDPEEYVSATDNFEDMTTAELYELVGAVNVSLVQWQTEWTSLGKIVDDYENCQRRRVADAKYETRTRNLHQHGVNYEEPEFVVKGYKAKEREVMSETRYLQGQDRIMAAAYGFEYDPHPSKIGRQNPETQQVGIMTRGRSLRNQPRQTAKATETDEVTGKRTRKPVQLFDPAAQDVSRSSTPAPSRTRRRRTGNGDDDMVTSSFNGDANSDVDEPPSRTRRRRGGRPLTSAPQLGDDSGASQDAQDAADEVTRPSRRGRHRAAIRYDDGFLEQDVEEEQQQQKQPKRHLLTLKIPRGKNFSEPSSAITDNGDSRPSTASSESSSHTAESSYSFRPKRQKRFRDDQEEAEAAGQGPPKKRGRRVPEEAPPAAAAIIPAADTSPAAARKTPKIKVVRVAQASRTGTPSSIGGDAEEPRKDYKLMTKSEKMSASMKSRWANGNMAGAVEKRKATLAAKKAAQAAADQKLGTTTPKGNKVKPKKEAPPRQDSQQPLPPSTPGVGVPFSAA
ncbi:hypothetical protein MY10362_008279 [Beauveria mimosiformis]